MVGPLLACWQPIVDPVSSGPMRFVLGAFRGPQAVASARVLTTIYGWANACDCGWAAARALTAGYV